MSRTATTPLASVELRVDLAVANQILFNQELNDGYGHVSVRHDRDPGRYVMLRDPVLGVIDAESCVEFDLESDPIPGREGRCKERFIHGEIYKSRPDVTAVVHTHAVDMILFSVLSDALRPIYHMSSFLGDAAPVFEIRTVEPRSDLLITDPKRGKALATALGSCALVLMRGHGASVVGSSLKEAVYRTVYAAQNARLQIDASRFGNATYLDASEIQHIDNSGSYDKAWRFWKERALRNSPAVS